MSLSTQRTNDNNIQHLERLCREYVVQGQRVLRFLNVRLEECLTPARVMINTVQDNVFHPTEQDEFTTFQALQFQFETMTEISRQMQERYELLWLHLQQMNMGHIQAQINFTVLNLGRDIIADFDSYTQDLRRLGQMVDWLSVVVNDIASCSQEGGLTDHLASKVIRQIRNNEAVYRALSGQRRPEIEDGRD